MTTAEKHYKVIGMTHDLTITLAQMTSHVGDIAANLHTIKSIWEEMEGQTDLIVFPELALSGYPPEDLLLNPAYLKDCEAALDALVHFSTRKKTAILLGTPLIDHWHKQKSNGPRKALNAAVLIDDGVQSTPVIKCTLPTYGVFDEHRVFAPEIMSAPIPFRGHALGVMICEDMWRPKVARELAEQGADLFIVLSASPYETAKMERRLHWASQHAQTHEKPLIHVNMVGAQDELVFDGRSFALNPDETLYTCLRFAEDRVSLTFNAADSVLTTEAQSHEATDHPDHDDYHALLWGLRNYVQGGGFSKVLLGLSGGVDSAIVAVLAADALGAENVRGVMLRSQFTSEDSLDDAKALAENLGIAYVILDIEQSVAAVREAISPALPQEPAPVTFENLQSRTRGVMLMALSNASGALLLTTGNKSELATGYATLYGDMCGAFNPIKDVYKTRVYELCRWRNANKPEGFMSAPTTAPFPERVLTKAPTAELKPDQTDQDTLPEYSVLDGLLKEFIEDHREPQDLDPYSFDIPTAEHVYKMLARSEYKRFQAPPGTKITTRSFGRDWRMPLTRRG